jgi:hypothetical protein
LAIISDAAAAHDLAIAGADRDTVAGRRIIAEAYRRYQERTARGERWTDRLTCFHRLPATRSAYASRSELARAEGQLSTPFQPFEPRLPNGQPCPIMLKNSVGGPFWGFTERFPVKALLLNN